MAKGQKRSNREIKKPKQPPKAKPAAGTSPYPTSTARPAGQPAARKK